MAGIAEQGDASLRPALHRAAHHQRPFVRGIDTVNKSVNVLVPTEEVIDEFTFGTFDGPGFHCPVVALDHADEVHEFAAPYWVVQHMPTGSEPIRSDHSRKVRWQPLRRHQATP